MNDKYTPIIGIEIHVELNTKSKMFCSCEAYHFNTKPNTLTCPVCLGLPGALPVPNKKAVEWTMMIGKALGCNINQHSKFDRKHYFYPDLPKGYQISQYDQPLCESGKLTVAGQDVGITRVHLEEDTGKLQHTVQDGEEVSLVDFNRSGVPLVEIVSDPDIFDSQTAKEYAEKIRNIVQFLGVSDGDLEKGSMRLEANISLTTQKGTFPEYKVEVKNINSFNYLKQAIDYEIERQAKILDSGDTPRQETRGWNEFKSETFSQRSKEGAEDYRYFPEPDIPPMEFSDDEIEDILKDMPPLPQEYRDRFINDYNIRQDYVEVLTEHRKLSQKAKESFEIAKTKEISPEEVANWLVNKKSQTEDKNPEEIIQMIDEELNKPEASEEKMREWVKQVLSSNPGLIKKYKAGKTTVIGAFIGQVMGRSKGQADPQKVRQILLKMLEETN